MKKKNGHKATLETVVEAIEQTSAATNERLDKLIEIFGGHWRDLEKRVQALERKVG